MIRLLAAVLLFWQPLRFAAEALSVYPTMAYRGTVAVLELVVHGAVAALSAAAGLALFNATPDGRRLALLAVIAVAARTVQSLYFSVLPDNTPPGLEPLYAGTAVAVAAAGIIVLRSART